MPPQEEEDKASLALAMWASHSNPASTGEVVDISVEKSYLVTEDRQEVAGECEAGALRFR